VGKCEGMSSHIPKWIPILGIRVPVDSQIFKKRFEESKFIGLEISLSYWKFLKMQMSKMGLHYPFEYL
jgi:hypothetical protein